VHPPDATYKLSCVIQARVAPALPAALFAVSAFLAGGYYESTTGLLAAAVWLALSVAASLGAARRPSPAFWALAALAAWSLCSAAWGPLGRALATTPLLVLYAGVLLAAEWLPRRTTLRALLGATTVVCLVALLGEPFVAGSRLSWPVTYANGLGLVAVTGVLLAQSQVALSHKVRWASGVVCGVAAVLTFSRGALLAGAALLLARRLPRRVGIAAAVALAVLAVVFARPLAARFAAPQPDTRDAHRLVTVSGHGRTRLWRIAWHEGRDHPLAGGGAGTWPRHAVAELGLDAPANAHSLYLETFAELGAVGLALLLAFVALAARRDDTLAMAALAVAAAADWEWQLPAATFPALIAAGAAFEGRRVGRASLGLALAALVLGVAAGLHGLGAALLESGRPAQARRLLPGDARPDAAEHTRAAFLRGCRLDAGEPALRYEAPTYGGCPARR
jgi:O-antigen ligase